MCEAAGDVAATYSGLPPYPPPPPGIPPNSEFVLVADTADGVNGCDTSNAKKVHNGWREWNLDKCKQACRDRYDEGCVPSCTLPMAVHDAIAVRPHAPAG